MQKQKKPLPTRKRVIRVTSPEDKANRARQENDRNRAIASYYFDDTPTLPNLVKGAYYWAKGNLFGSSEDPEDYRYMTGTAPIIGGPLRAVSSTGAKVLKEVVGKRPGKVTEIVNNGVKTFQRGVSHGVKIGRKEGAEQAVNAMQGKISRAYRLGVQRGTQTAERANQQTSKQAIQAAKKRGAEIQREWSSRSARQTPTNVSTAQQTIQQAAETPGLGFWGNTRRVLWETKGNNFGNSYKWRNAGRVPIFLSGFPYITGTFFGATPRYFEYVGKSFAKGYKAGIGGTNQADSTKTNSLQVDQKTANQVQPDTITPILRQNVRPDTITPNQMDSINAYFSRP